MYAAHMYMYTTDTFLLISGIKMKYFSIEHRSIDISWVCYRHLTIEGRKWGVKIYNNYMHLYSKLSFYSYLFLCLFCLETTCCLHGFDDWFPASSQLIPYKYINVRWQFWSQSVLSMRQHLLIRMICRFVCLNWHTFIYMYVCIYTYMYIDIHLYAYMYMYIYMNDVYI
jgi:hypothetical protein